MTQQEKTRYYLLKDICSRQDLINSLDSLEAKEVDLEKEIKTAYKNNLRYLDKYNMLVVLNELQFTDIAKYFFELGLKANGE